MPANYEFPANAIVLANPPGLGGEPVGLCYPPGTTVCQFHVRARAVPWSAAIRRFETVKQEGKKDKRVSRGAPVNPKLAQWQSYVRSAARQQMMAKPPHSGPYVVHASFALVRRGPMPDYGNLLKSTEDAIQGIVVLNDKQGRGAHVVYNPDAQEQLTIIRIVAQ